MKRVSGCLEKINKGLCGASTITCFQTTAVERGPSHN
jgi:hypothetical protein